MAEKPTVPSTNLTIKQILTGPGDEIITLRKLVIALQHELVEKNKTIRRAKMRMEAALKLAKGE